MTINKSQGQTLNHVGIYLKNPVFSHGQLYVALSRVTNSAGVLILKEDQTSSSTAMNVVYPEILS
jgi:ATP-dependent exoDNAse (exonuclease V) alpha subunit